MDKYSIEQNIEQCQHPAEGTHIQVLEQVRPQGMKKQRKNNEIRVSLSGFRFVLTYTV